MARRSKYIKPDNAEFLTAAVVATKQLSPNFVRVTIGGEALRRFTPMGFDQWFRLFLPNASGTLRLPTRSDNLWVAQYMMMGRDTKPIGRNYTVRSYRERGPHGEWPEIDIDFVLHEDESGHMGPAATWAASAAAGDEVGIRDEGITYQPPHDAVWQLLVGDETALPALLGILRDAPRELRAEVFIEIPHVDDAQDKEDVPDGANIHWLVRSDGAAPALDAVRAVTIPDGPGYAFVAGAQKLVSTVRRHLVHDRKIPKESITFTGYWR